jgi:hypothetical protein
VRDDEEVDRAVQDIRDNPVKAGLKDWPWVYVNVGKRGQTERRRFR